MQFSFIPYAAKEIMCLQYTASLLMQNISLKDTVSDPWVIYPLPILYSSVFVPFRLEAQRNQTVDETVR
jgi:hypothetical protein